LVQNWHTSDGPGYTKEWLTIG